MNIIVCHFCGKTNRSDRTHCLSCGTILRRPVSLEANPKEIIIDLHGYSPQEALDEFVRLYNFQVQNNLFQRLKIIHGYGSSGEGGIIRERFRAFLQRNSDRLGIIDGESIDGNPGYTIVEPQLTLPTRFLELAEEILAYCQPAKTEDKIYNKFRFQGTTAIRNAIKQLIREDRLIEFQDGRYKKYKTV